MYLKEQNPSENQKRGELSPTKWEWALTIFAMLIGLGYAPPFGLLEILTTPKRKFLEQRMQFAQEVGLSPSELRNTDAAWVGMFIERGITTALFIAALAYVTWRFRNSHHELRRVFLLMAIMIVTGTCVSLAITELVLPAASTQQKRDKG